MALGSILGDIGLSEQLVLSYIIGIAGAPAVRPYVQTLVNDAWASNPAMPPPVVVVAQGVAQGQITLDQGRTWANAAGFSNDVLDGLVDAANVGLPLGQAFQSWRRGDLSDGQFQTQLHRLGIESEWWPMLEALKHDRLDLGALATAVHRGIMDDAGLLVTSVPQGSGNIPRIPLSPLDTLAEFAAHGIDKERARVLIADTGLPLALGEMLQLYNRGKVTATDVQVSIAESNVRNEYMDVALDLARRLLTPHEYAEAELRGYLTHEQAVAGAGLSGIEHDDYATLFEIMGRPLAVRQITTGLARGGNYGGTYDDVPAGPFRDAIRRSAIRPEYAALAYANRYSYPSLFQISRLVSAGTIDAATGSKWAKESGLAPEVVTALENAWKAGSTAANPHVAKAQTQLWTTLHRSYVAEETDDTTAGTILTQLGVSPSAQAQVLTLWQAERSLVRKQLTPAQVKKAYTSAVINPATGVAWTQDDATAALLDRGYSHNDATTYLST